MIINNKTYNLKKIVFSIIAFVGVVVGLSTTFGYTFLTDSLGFPELPFRYVSEFTTKTSDLWIGIYHGAMIPVSMFRSYFDPTVTLWDANNTGIGYNFGLLLALVLFLIYLEHPKIMTMMSN
jgi:hypothetical protein